MSKSSIVDRSKMSIYRDKQLIRAGKDDTEDDQRTRLFWWNQPEDTMAASAISAIKFIQDHQPTRITQLTASTRLYSNSSTNGFLIGSFRSSTQQAPASQPGSGRISFNLCASITDTLVSKMAKNKVIPTFLTSGGVWGMQRKAEQLSKFVEGCFYANDIHKLGIDVFRDACVWGTGILHIFAYNNQIFARKVFPHEIVVDEIDALNGNPKQLHRIELIDRAELMVMFKDNEKALEKIRNASASNALDMGAVGATAADILTVTHSWKLASDEDSNDGKYLVCLNDETLCCETYSKTYFPYVFYNYNKRLIGFWGQGAVERTQNLQCEINKLMILIQKAMWMGGGFKILIENGSKVVKQHLDNEVGTIITYTGTPPQYISPPMIQAEIYPYVDALIAKGYQQEGVSQLAASSLKPLGIDSGAALRTYDQISEDRSLFTAQELEGFYLEVARQMIEVAKDIYKKKKSYKVIYPGTMSFETIDWKDVKLKKEDYVLKAFPTSSLPDDPSGKLATVQEYMAAGLISPRAGRRLLAMPDMEMSDKLANAAENMIHNLLEDMMNKGEYRPPEPYYNLSLAKELSIEYYNFGSLNNCPEDRLELVRQFMSQVDDLTGIAAQALPQINPPQANPTPTPTSPLIQNTNTPPQGA